MTDYAAILDCYSIEDILELNDMTAEELLIYLVEEKVISLPEVTPLDLE